MIAARYLTQAQLRDLEEELRSERARLERSIATRMGADDAAPITGSVLRGGTQRQGGLAVALETRIFDRHRDARLRAAPARGRNLRSLCELSQSDPVRSAARYARGDVLRQLRGRLRRRFIPKQWRRTFTHHGENFHDHTPRRAQHLTTSARPRRPREFRDPVDRRWPHGARAASSVCDVWPLDEATFCCAAGVKRTPRAGGHRWSQSRPSMTTMMTSTGLPVEGCDDA